MLTENDLKKKIKKSLIFSDLTEKQYSLILSCGQVLKLAQNKILFQKGDPVDYVYILLAGELSVVLLGENEQTSQIIGSIDPGESIGELAALTDKERSASIQAVSNSTLLRFSTHDFLNIINSIPQILLKITKSLALRSQNLIKQLDIKEETTFTAMLLNSDDDLTQKFLYKLKENTPESIMFLSCLEVQGLTWEKLLSYLEELTKKYSSIVCIFNAKNKNLLLKYLKKAQSIYFISTYKNLNFFDAQLKNRVEKIFKGKPCSIVKIAKEPSDSLRIENVEHLSLFTRHHHLCINNPLHYQSLIRHISGTQIGLVLSGGGAKGWTHLGVLKAIEELGIPIDMIGGVSAGSVAASSYALHVNFKKAVSSFTDIMDALRDPLKIRNFCWPTISIFTGKAGTIAIQKNFSGLIEEFQIPFFCVSANLSTYKESVHIKGEAWKAIRASVSIPGLAPPMVIDNQMHVDGGIINNLPVDVMRSLLGPKSKIIAVSLGGGHHSDTQYNFPPVLSSFDLIKNYWNGKKDYVFPKFGNFLMNAFMMGAASKEIEARNLADIIIQPDVSMYNFIGSTPKQETELMKLGYELAKLKLREYGLERLLF